MGFNSLLFDNCNKKMSFFKFFSGNKKWISNLRQYFLFVLIFFFFEIIYANYVKCNKAHNHPADKQARRVKPESQRANQIAQVNALKCTAQNTLKINPLGSCWAQKTMEGLSGTSDRSHVYRRRLRRLWIQKRVLSRSSVHRQLFGRLFLQVLHQQFFEAISGSILSLEGPLHI